MVHYPPFYKNNHYTDFTSLRLVHTTLEEFVNAALFPHLSNFSKTLFNPEEFENAGFAFSCRWETFWKRGFSETMTSR